MRKFASAFVLFFIATLCVSSSCFGAEVTIVYTGSTQGMIYPCDCPIEPDGGLARRATLIKELRKKHPGLLLLDAGNSFAGGAMDEYSQNAEQDLQRSLINLGAMQLMGYDAAAVQEAEFNFGRENFVKNIVSLKTPFLSSNIEDIEGVKPYIIKDTEGVKIGIIALTSPVVAARVALKITEPKKAAADAVAELKKQGADLVILLSGLGIETDRDLIKSLPDINIVISSAAIAKESLFDRKQDNYFLAPVRQGRKLSLLKLSVEGKKISDLRLEHIRLSGEIKDDPEVSKILPACFSDTDCKKAGLVGACLDPGTMKAKCVFLPAAKIKLLIVSARDCRVCETKTMQDVLKRNFPGLETSYLYYPDAKAKKLLKDLSIDAIPAYLLGKEIEKENKFPMLGGILDKKGDYYLVKPEFSGFSYFPERKKIPGRFDLFVSLFDNNTPGVLEVSAEFKPQVHFLAIKQGAGFNAAAGIREVEEERRAVCVRKLYPERFWDYISCRALNPDTSWWEDCAQDMDMAPVRACAKSEEGAALLGADIALNKELAIVRGPTYLLDNKEIFSTNGVPKKEELRKIIRGEK